tara:strand:+ start:18741 stop:19328 length:588 start_codon:yes stop_codon:yes gene_type:complete
MGRRLILKRLNKKALEALDIKLNPSELMLIIRRARQTFNTSECMSTLYKETEPREGSEYPQITRRVTSGDKLYKDDYNIIYCAISEEIRNMANNMKTDGVIEGYTEQDIKRISIENMNNGLELIMDNPICDKLIDVGHVDTSSGGVEYRTPTNSEYTWAMDILVLPETTDLEISGYVDLTEEIEEISYECQRLLS